jgi:hypothetical protein
MAYPVLAPGQLGPGQQIFFVLPPVAPSLTGVRIHFAALKLLPIDGAANAVTITLSGPNP